MNVRDDSADVNIKECGMEVLTQDSDGSGGKPFRDCDEE